MTVKELIDPENTDTSFQLCFGQRSLLYLPARSNSSCVRLLELESDRHVAQTTVHGNQGYHLRPPVLGNRSRPVPMTAFVSLRAVKASLGALRHAITYHNPSEEHEGGLFQGSGS